ncbi:MAG: hypothetical protein RMK91_08760 [Pseudanabaenaceae cyanobacterium SKYGB_i_bin29]|nr:hypothetical protein [Pseudanabaenaceae cyanobacterium SKYG29]MDW8421946.1 hypothetical protein [Pseudanabaenaceae cyanobacterium SKYGB_i_bin29]
MTASSPGSSDDSGVLSDSDEVAEDVSPSVPMTASSPGSCDDSGAIGGLGEIAEASF